MRATVDIEDLGFWDQAVHFFGNPGGCELIILTGDNQRRDLDFLQEILGAILLRALQEGREEEWFD